MGRKQEKKIKSDRINALRKQYDAFLEEDKKRKERNQYILGKLDNIRYSSTAINARSKRNPYAEVYSSNIGSHGHTPQNSRQNVHINLPTQYIPQINPQNLQLDVLRHHPDTELLKEITNKYILIPKLTNSGVNIPLGPMLPTVIPTTIETVSPSQSYNVVPDTKTHNISNDNDWKSKYDILNHLKSHDVDKVPDLYEKDDIYPVKDEGMHLKETPRSSNNLPRYKSNETFMPSKEIPMSDPHGTEVSVEKQLKQMNIIEQSNENSKTLNINSKHSYEIPNLNPVAPEPSQDVNVVVKETNVQKFKDDVNVYETINVKPGVEELVSNNDFTTAEVTLNESSKNQEIEEIVDQNAFLIEHNQQNINEEAEQSYVQYNETNYQPVTQSDTSNIEGGEHINNNDPSNDNIHNADYPIDVINEQDFTPTDDVELKDNININPEGYLMSAETPELPNDTNIVEEKYEEQTTDEVYNPSAELLNDVQGQIYYPEEFEENAQPQTEESYNQEYPQNDQAPTEEEYAYYQEQQQAYPVEINEHEETSQPYDTNYEEQYAQNYAQGYEQGVYNSDGQEYDPAQQQPQYEQSGQYNETQQQMYEQTQQQAYEQPQEQMYEQNQQYGDYQYEQQEIAQNVEQVLDSEEGYARIDDAGTVGQGQALFTEKEQAQ